MPAQPHEQHTLSMRSQRRLFRVLHAVARRPRTTLLALLVAVAPLAAAGAGLTPDNSLAVWFVRDDPALAGYRAFQREFGNDEVVAVSYRAPAGAFAPAEARVQRRAAARLRGVDGIDQVLAPALLADSIGMGEQARAFLWRSGLVSRDARTVTLLARVSARPDIDEVRGDILDSVRVAVRQTLTDARPAHFAGIGVVYDALNRQTIKDSGFYLGVAFLVMGALLWLALRRWRSVAIALVPPVVVSVMTTGLFVLTDQPFTQVTSILPMLVLVIGLSDAIHLVTHYYAERRAHGALIGPDARREMVARSAAWVALPNLFTALTTAAGFVALASSRMPAIRDLGLFAGIAMLILWVMTLLVGTAALSLWDVPPPPERPQGGRMDHALAWLSIHVPRWRWAVLGAMTAITAVLLVGAARVRADTYTLELLPPDHAAVTDSRWIEANAGNYTPLEFVVRARERGVDTLRTPGVLNPEVLRRIAEWQRRAEARPDVDRTFGVADLAAAGRAVPGGGYVSADGREGRVTAFVPMTSTRGFTGTVRELEAEGARVLGPAAAIHASGYLPLYLRIVDYVVSGTIAGLAISTVIVFAMVGILLRSLKLTAAAVPTNLFPVALVFGVMGWTGIPLDIATATIGAIVLGIAVDDTIHFLFRYRAERQAGASPEEAVGVTYRETGRAVVFASMVLAIGFAVLATSSSRSIAYFGIVASISIVGAMLADLFLLPVMLLLGRRRVDADADQPKPSSTPIATPEPAQP